MAQYIKRMRTLFHVMQPTAGTFVRIGRERDGGYIMLDDFSGHHIAYSFGISNDVSWDADMAVRGLDVYMYDHTIAGLPESNERFHWQKTGLAGTFNESKPELRTLPQLLTENDHDAMNKMILKMDIEGAEWDALKECPPAVWGQFSQCVFEFHGLNNTAKEDEMADALTNLNAAQQLVHVHANNFRPYVMAGGLVMPDVLECTYLNRAEYSFEKSNKFFPTAIDQANDPMRAEIILGNWGMEVNENGTVS